MIFRLTGSTLYCIAAVIACAVMRSDGGLVAAAPANDPPKTLTPLGCVGGDSSSDCPKSWYFSGGSGYVGQRATDPNTKIMCSPSCTARDGSVDKQCSLIMVLHGIYSNPGDMIWLMLGSVEGSVERASEVFSESEEDGGPFCISFHKSEGDPWDYSCDRNDADHFKDFIPWILEEFPAINPEAIFLHGFSSGAIMTNTLMFASCEIEGYISGAAPYAGLIASPPTTKAAYLVPHGTHDNVVPYQEDWVNGQAIPSCECNGLAGGQASCFFDNNWIQMVGPSLASGIATLRGYEGSVWGTDIDNLPVSHLNLVDIDSGKCQENIDRCINPLTYPNNPFNDDYPCNNLQEEETDVFVLPTDDDSGPVVLWRINYHNHDYPNRRRSSWGPTEFFFQLKKFFYANRGRYSRGVHGTVQITNNVACSDPDFDGFTPPVSFFRYDYWRSDHLIITKEKCQKKCEDDFRCTDAFYGEYSGDPYCKFYFDNMPCKSTYSRSWGNEVHYKMGDLIFSPTVSPSASPVADPSPTPTTAPPVVTLPPTPEPTNPAPDGICPGNSEFDPNAQAGYSCTTGGDSNAGSTEQDCLAANGQWNSYDCAAAQAFWNIYPIEALRSEWEPKCCENILCLDDTVLNGDATAGYSCSTGTDSNFGETEEGCLANGGQWNPYDCAAAASYFRTATEYVDDFRSAWTPKCCSEDNPTFSPTSPTSIPTVKPSVDPSATPTVKSSESPTVTGSNNPSATLSESPTVTSSESPTLAASENPTVTSSEAPTAVSSESPTLAASENPTVTSSGAPTAVSSESPTLAASENPTVTSSEAPTAISSESPTVIGSSTPTVTSSQTPTVTSSESPTVIGSSTPTVTSSESPTVIGSSTPTVTSSTSPTIEASEPPTAVTSESPTAELSESPTVTSSQSPTAVSSESPSVTSSQSPTVTSSESPSVTHSETPTVTSSESPSVSPTTNPTANPTVKPTPEPTDATPDGICPIADELNADATAGYSCTAGGDSNFGTTEADCLAREGLWQHYNCETAEYYLKFDAAEDIKDDLKNVWEPQCCGGPPNTPLCPADTVLDDPSLAGHACLIDGVSVADSNFGATSEGCPGLWTPYDCATASAHIETKPEYEAELREVWTPKCCLPEQDNALCPADTVLDDPALAGYACLVNGVSIADSNFGATSIGCPGDWTPYDCATAAAYIETEPDYEAELREVWTPKCCLPEKDTSLCPSDTLNGGSLAGYACLVNVVSIADSNFGATSIGCPGLWTPYDCTTANAHIETEPEYETELRAVWTPKCCGGSRRHLRQQAQLPLSHQGPRVLVRFPMDLSLDEKVQQTGKPGNVRSRQRP